MASIYFLHPINGALLMENSGEISLTDIDLTKESIIFKSIDDLITTGGFDYFYYNNILIIPDNMVTEKELNVHSECQIDGMGEIWLPIKSWVLFLTIKTFNDEFLEVQSLHQSDNLTVRNKLQLRKRIDYRLINSNIEDCKVYTKYSVVKLK